MWDKVGQGGDQCKELATSKESLNSSLAYSLPSKKDFEGEVLKLNDDLVANSNIYFGRAKEQVSMFYPILDLNMLDIFEVIRLMDD